MEKHCHHAIAWAGVIITLLLLSSATAAPMRKLPKAPPSPPGLKAKLALKRTAPAPTTVPPITEPASTMTASFRVVNSEFGTYEFTASELQPASHTIEFSRSLNPASGYWEPLATWGPSSTDQRTSISFYTYSESYVVRAIVTLVPASIRRPGFPTANVTSIHMNGVKAWREPATNATAKRFTVNTKTAKTTPITTSSKFTARCPYCDKSVISRSCSRNGATTSTNGVVESWAIGYRCRSCKMDFTDARQQVIQDVKSIRLPIR